MSDDASPTGGRLPPGDDDAAADNNSSLIDKVRSRVSSIIPFGRWFSPTTSHEDGSRNGGVRRRRNDVVGHSEEVADCEEDSQDESECDEDEDVAELAPPSKKSRLNIEENNSPMSSFQIMTANTASNFLSSTPTTLSRRKQLATNLIRQTYESSSSTTVVHRSNTELNRLEDNDPDGADVVELIPGYPGSERIQFSSSRRNLNIPTTKPPQRPMRRPSLHTMRGNASLYRSSPEEEDGAQYQGTAEANERTEKILTNGVRASPSFLLPDTASESGESQASSLQKIKVTGPFDTGTKRFRTSMGSGLNYAAHLQGKKSLFGDKNMPTHLNNSTTSLTSLNRRQSFNASLYGSTSALSDSRLLNIYSPFYKGCTTYGGASAYSQHARRINPPQILTRPSTSMSTLSSSSNSVVPAQDTSPAISNTAKRILELMNQFTTPLTDVKKMANNARVPALIAHRQRFTDHDRSATNRGIRMAIPKTPYTRSSAAAAESLQEQQQLIPPINELQVPTMSQLLQMKKLQRNTERIREITNQAKNKFNLEAEYKLPTVQQDEGDRTPIKHVNKIRNKLTNARTGSRAAAAAVINVEETVQPVALPDVTLPTMESVPKIDIEISLGPRKSLTVSDSKTTFFSIGSVGNTGKQSKLQFSNTKIQENTRGSVFPTVISAPSVTHAAQPKLVQTDANSLQPSPKKLVNGGMFVFSLPIQVASTVSVQDNSEPISNFKFSDPALVADGASDVFNAGGNFAYQPTSSVNKPKTAPGATTNAASNVGMPAVASQLKTTGSVLDAFKKPPSTASETSPLSVSKTLPSSSFGGQFKMSSDKWECSVCMIRNDNTVEKCVACSNPRNSSTEPATILPIQTQSEPKIEIKNTFGDKFKATIADTWECPTCMIRNKIDVSKCAACETPQPGVSSVSNETAPAAAAASQISSSLVPKTMDSGFKTIVAQQSAKWECSTCMTRNESARTKCLCCEQAKPGAISENVPQFSFGTSSTAASKFSFGFADKKEVDLKSGSNEPAKLDGSKSESMASDSNIGFQFGTTAVSAASSTPAPAGSFSFGYKPATTTKTDSTATVNSDEPDKRQTASKLSFGTVSTVQATKPEAVPSVDRSQTVTPPFKLGTSGSSAFSAPTPKSETTSNTSTVTSENSSTLSSSVFKPIGGFAFGNSAEKTAAENATKSTFAFGMPKSETKSTVQTTNSFTLSGSSTAASSQSTTVPTEISKPFAFGTPTLAGSSISKSTEKPAGFSFGSASAGSVSKSPNPTTAVTTVASIDSPAPNFVFGSAPSVDWITPTFGAISSNVVTSTNINVATTAAPSFGSLSATKSSTTIKSFQPQPAATQTSTSSIPAFGGGSTSSVVAAPPTTAPAPPSLFGSSSFSASTSSSTLDNKATGLFSFGGTAPAIKQPDTQTVTTAAPIFGSVSSTTSTPFSFGANATHIVPATRAATAPFVFGAAALPKPAEPVIGSGLFGSVQNTSASSQPTFGTLLSPSTQTQQQPAAAPTFGQSSAISSPFGSGNLSTGTPAFGSAAVNASPVFGSATFGSAGAVATAGTSFGTPAAAPAANTTFGSSAVKSPLFGSSSFGSGPAPSGDDPAAKKLATGFGFGSTPQNSATGGFSFGASSSANNNNNNKQPFVFSGGSAPSFNFSGSSESNSNARSSIGSTTTTKSKTCIATVSTAVDHITAWLKPARKDSSSSGNNNNNNRTMVKLADQQRNASNNSSEIITKHSNKTTAENFALDDYIKSNTTAKTSTTLISTNTLTTAAEPASANRINKSLDELSLPRKKVTRKVLVSLRSRKPQYVLDRFAPKLSPPIIQRKLYYVNRKQPTETNISRTNNNNMSKDRFKFVRKNVSGKTVIDKSKESGMNSSSSSSGGGGDGKGLHDPGHGTGIIRGETVSQATIAKRSTSRVKMTACNRNRVKSKPKDSTTFVTRATRFKYDPAKFKYIKPSD